MAKPYNLTIDKATASALLLALAACLAILLSIGSNRDKPSLAQPVAHSQRTAAHKAGLQAEHALPARTSMPGANSF
jgi:hypothetical protein